MSASPNGASTPSLACSAPNASSSSLAASAHPLLAKKRQSSPSLLMSVTTRGWSPSSSSSASSSPSSSAVPLDAAANNSAAIANAASVASAGSSSGGGSGTGSSSSNIGKGKDAGGRRTFVVGASIAEVDEPSSPRRERAKSSSPDAPMVAPESGNLSQYRQLPSFDSNYETDSLAPSSGPPSPLSSMPPSNLVSANTLTTSASMPHTGTGSAAHSQLVAGRSPSAESPLSLSVSGNVQNLRGHFQQLQDARDAGRRSHLPSDVAAFRLRQARHLEHLEHLKAAAAASPSRSVSPTGSVLTSSPSPASAAPPAAAVSSSPAGRPYVARQFATSESSAASPLTVHSSLSSFQGYDGVLPVSFELLNASASSESGTSSPADTLQRQRLSHVRSGSRHSTSSGESTVRSAPKNVYEALYDYRARRNEEVSIGKGNTLKVLQKHDDSGDPDWWKADMGNGVVGFVPAGYLTESRRTRRVRPPIVRHGDPLDNLFQRDASAPAAANQDGAVTGALPSGLAKSRSESLAASNASFSPTAVANSAGLLDAHHSMSPCGAASDAAARLDHEELFSSEGPTYAEGDLDIMDDESRCNFARLKTIEELLETERSYLDSLMNIVDVFMYPLFERLERSHGVINRVIIRDIFSELPAICNVNGVLLQDVENIVNRFTIHVHQQPATDRPRRGSMQSTGSGVASHQSATSMHHPQPLQPEPFHQQQPSVQPPSDGAPSDFEFPGSETTFTIPSKYVPAMVEEVARVFVRMSPFLKIYTAYVRNFDYAMETLATLGHTSKAWRKFLRLAEADPRCHRLPLDSLLIMPVQRVPRYKLLLKELQKHTPGHENTAFKLLDEAVTKLDEVMAHINAKTKENDARMRVTTLQNELRGLRQVRTRLVQPDRTFVQEGRVFELEGSSISPRVLLLFNDCLILGRESTGPLRRLPVTIARTVIPLRSTWVTDVSQPEPEAAGGGAFRASTSSTTASMSQSYTGSMLAPAAGQTSGRTHRPASRKPSGESNVEFHTSLHDSPLASLGNLPEDSATVRRQKQQRHLQLRRKRELVKQSVLQQQRALDAMQQHEQVDHDREDAQLVDQGDDETSARLNAPSDASTTGLIDEMPMQTFSEESDEALELTGNQDYDSPPADARYALVISTTVPAFFSCFKPVTKSTVLTFKSESDKMQWMHILQDAITSLANTERYRLELVKAHLARNKRPSRWQMLCCCCQPSTDPWRLA
ncbi:hypothetical protein CAOG_03988 [Capsaspora owczarzaki ATCC 30864]|nr:hypothetical protein CAOG_03988 [Capsaspora owczarzaki ATCC 30864]|eukprot:XP_004347813.1 hypothetical protein CAOG_03988 [Capsaspora owczarzaki ATCC 30864]